MYVNLEDHTISTYDGRIALRLYPKLEKVELLLWRGNDYYGSKTFPRSVLDNPKDRSNIYLYLIGLGGCSCIEIEELLEEI